MPEHFAAIGMGSNLNHPLANMNRAVSLLQALPHCRQWRFSSLYESEAVDCPEPLTFLNAVAICQTDLEPLPLLDHLLNIEDQFGRERPYVNAPRPLDLDLLLFADQLCNQPRLILPHPRMPMRLFVLEPLAELCPERVHPGNGQSISALLKHCRSGPHGVHGVTRCSQPWPDALF